MGAGMTTLYIGAVLGMLGGNIVLKLTWLAKGEPPERTRVGEAVDVFFFVLMLIFGVIALLNK